MMATAARPVWAAAGSAHETQKDERSMVPDPLPQLPELPDSKAAQKAAHDNQRRPRPRWLKVVILAARSLTVLVLGLTALFLCLLLAVQLNADRLTSNALERLTRESGIDISFRDAGIHLLPLPGLILEDVEIHPREGLVFKARALIAAPNLFSLIRAKFEPEFVIVDEPTLYGTLDTGFGALAGALAAGVPGQEAGAEPLSLNDILPLHCRVHVHDGQLQLVDRDGACIRLTGLETRLTCANPPLHAFDRVGGEVRISSLDVRTRDFAAALRDVAFSGRCSPHDPAGTLEAGLSGRGAMTPMGLAASVSLRVDANGGTPKASWRTSGSFALDGAVIPWALDGSAEGGGSAAHKVWADVVPGDIPASQSFALTIDRFNLGDDRLHLDGLLRADPRNPAVYGRLAINRVSLTRWLDFARGLSPGLQIALDDIRDGHIDFAVDRKGLSCPRVRARAAGSVFAGEGGVEAWAKPVVFLDMTSAFVDLGRAIPEAVGVIRDKPDYGHKCLTAMTMADIFPRAAGQSEASASPPAEPKQADVRPAAPAQAQQPDKTRTQGAAAAAKRSESAAEQERWLGYDIRLKAERIHYGYIDLTNGGVVITPGVNSRGESSARIAMQSGLYDGQVWGDAWFSGETETEYEFAVNTKDVNLSGLHKAMSFILVNRGTGRCQVRVRSKGSEINRFLSNLQGTINLSVVRAAMEDDRYFSPFRSDITLSLASAAFRNSALGLNGRWQVDYRASDWAADGSLQGQIWFGGEGDRAGIRFDNMDADVKGRDMEHLLSFCKGQSIPVSLKGKAFCDSSRLQFGAKQARLEAPGISARGDILVRKEGRLVSFTGDLASGSVNVPRLSAALIGRTPDVPALLQDLDFTDTHVAASEKGVNATRLHTRVDGTPVMGSASVSNFSATPLIEFNLHCGDINLDRHIRSTPARPAARTQPKERRQTLTAGDARTGRDKASPAPKPRAPERTWDCTWVRNWAAKGTIKADSLLVKKVRIRNLNVPLTLENGLLSLNNVTGTLYGGGLAASGTVRFDKGIDYKTRLLVLQFDLGALLRDRKTRGIFKASPDFRAELSSSMTGPGQMASHLNGTISFNSGSGSYQAADEDGSPSGRVTRFDSGRMTGTIKNGVLHMNSFSLTGEDLRLIGEGEFDLANETMDADFEADLPNLPTVPLRLHGTFDNPKTSIGGMVIFNAIGGLIKGLFSFVGDIFGGIFGIFH